MIGFSRWVVQEMGNSNEECKRWTIQELGSLPDDEDTRWGVQEMGPARNRGSGDGV